MSEPSSEPFGEGIGQQDEIVRRFDSRRNVKDAKKNGIKFDPNKGIGIPATTTNIEPVGPDRIREVTGARSADAWIDIDISGKKVLRRTTKEGRKEIVIQEDIPRNDIIGSGRTRRSRGSKEAHDESAE